ncbi:MAG: hypothetical protein K2M17_03670 [Bacilli bacterium]|nr:hypothetical protein [Bacilli bacterium]
MFIKDINCSNVLEFAAYLEIFQVNHSRFLKIMKYTQSDDAIDAEVVDEYGNTVRLTLGQNMALIDGVVTNDSDMWMAYLLHTFGEAYKSWLYDVRISEVDTTFVCQASGNPYSILFPFAVLTRCKNEKEIDSYLEYLQVICDHMWLVMPNEEVKLARLCDK